MKGINWHELAWELVERFTMRGHGAYNPAEGATWVLHHEDYREFRTDPKVVEAVASGMTRSDPELFCGFFVRPTDLSPEGILLIVKRDMLIGTVSLDDGRTMRVGPIPEPPRAMALR